MRHGHDVERLVAEITARQHGVISGRQMRWAGVARRTGGRWVQRGRLFRIGGVTYSLVPRVDDLGHAYAALLSAGADRHLEVEPRSYVTIEDARRATWLDGTVVISHWSALRLQRVATGPVLPVDVTVAGPGSRPRAEGVRGHHFQRLDPEDATVVAGMPATTVARALIDIAPSTPGTRLRRLVREAQFLGMLSRPELAATCARVPWHPGIPALAASDADLPVRLGGDSPLAGDLAVFLEHETALGPWTAQDPVVVRGRTYRLDFSRPDLAIAVEADGAGAHEQSQGRTADARRDADLLADGWVTVRVTDDRLKRESDDLRSTLHAIAAGRGWPGPPNSWLPRSAMRSVTRRRVTDARPRGPASQPAAGQESRRALRRV